MGSGKASSCKSQEIDFTMIRNIQGGGPVALRLKWKDPTGLHSSVSSTHMSM